MTKTQIIKKAKNAALVVIPLLLVVIGVLGTLQYQAFIDSVKAEGVAEYKIDKCDKFSDKKEMWYECK